MMPNVYPPDCPHPCNLPLYTTRRTPDAGKLHMLFIFLNFWLLLAAMRKI